MLITNSANLSGTGVGGAGNLVLGYAWMLNSNIVAGAQIEGGVSNIQARLTGSASSTSSSPSSGTTINSSTSTCLACSPPSTLDSFSSTTGTNTSSSASTLSVSNTLASRWVVSALARGGFLIDPQDLVYVVGGWTYAGFETPLNSAHFGLHGGTIGAGFERQIAPLWGVKVEYRYTKFLSRTVDLPFSASNTTVSNSNSSSPGNTSTLTSASTTSGNTAARFGADMQAVYVGVSRYFGTY
jgi:opacity protein-like surface antigen